MVRAICVGELGATVTGDQIIKLRQDAKWTQAWLAAFVGVHTRYTQCYKGSCANGQAMETQTQVDASG